METLAQEKEAATDTGCPPLLVRLAPVVHLTDDQLYEFSQLNRDLRIERTAQGELIIMPPTGGETGERNAEITMQLRLWAKRDGRGATFDSSSGFRLPNKAVRSPDAAWVEKSRLEKLPKKVRQKFLPLCPEFALELRSPTDSLSVVQAKMAEYIANGTQLGWLIDPEQRRVFIYRPQAPVEELADPETVSGEPLLVGFTLDLREIW